jgi:hypothetical protein
MHWKHLEREVQSPRDPGRFRFVGLRYVGRFESIRAAMATKLEESRHTSAFDRIEGMQGKAISSMAAETVVLSTEEAGEILRTSPPDELRARRASVKRARQRNAILRDAWLASLTP